MAASTKERILRFLEGRESATGPELAEHLGITRQAVNKHLKSLILEAKVEKQGSTRSASYRPAAPGRKAPRPYGLRRTYDLRGITEDQAFRQLEENLQLRRTLSPRSLEIVRYAFTEILNNAIDHSRSRRCAVEAALDPYECRFTIRDSGIGIYHSIRTKLGLPDEETALGELLKGKVTTMKERHSGEGIFFVSKAADVLRIRSHRTVLTFDNRAADTIVQEERFLKGTDVRFAIARRSRRSLERVFREYAPEEFGLEFQRTRVLVRLYLKEYVSRSEAKRLLAGLEKFREVVLDFDRVRMIGQGFADEVFRVFPSIHSGIAMKAENAAPAVATMIRHVIDNRAVRSVDN